MNEEKDGAFLGGSCNPTTWRKDIAIPAFEAAGISFYNPQVDNWHEGLIALEANAKANSKVLIFVIDGQTRAVVSMLEALTYAHAGRTVMLVVENIPDGTVIGGEIVTGSQLKDLNRGRSYLRDLVSDCTNTTIFETVGAAVEATINILITA